MDEKRHSGRIAVVTGGGSGIGRATVLRLASEGAAVFACDIDEAGFANVARDDSRDEGPHRTAT